MIDSKSLPLTSVKGSVEVPERLKYFNLEENLAVLATWGEGTPYTSIINFVITDDLKSVIIATPKDTRKFKNIKNSKYVSILIDNRTKTKGNLRETEAITIIGKARILKKGKLLEEMKKIYVAKHRLLENFVNAKTTSLICVDIDYCIHVGNFQSITIWYCKAKNKNKK